MPVDSATVTLVPLVPNARLPRVASARTRATVPSGYGVREQCLPFTAASALGVLIPSPIRFGLCRPEELPPGCRSFWSPLEQPEPQGRSTYSTIRTATSPATRTNSQATHDLIPAHRGAASRALASSIARISRTSSSFTCRISGGLVETEWYASPVNLVLGKPPGSAAGCAERLSLAQSGPRQPRARCALEIATPHSRLYDEALIALAQ